MTNRVVIDASPLIGLAMIDGLSRLTTLFGSVYLPETVKQEVLPSHPVRGKEAIIQAMTAGWLNIWPEPIPAILEIELDPCETDCINLALMQADKTLLIMD